MLRLLLLTSLLLLAAACDSASGKGDSPTDSPPADPSSLSDTTAVNDGGESAATDGADEEDAGPVDPVDTTEPADDASRAPETQQPTGDTGQETVDATEPEDTPQVETTPTDCPASCTLGDNACEGPLVMECVKGPDGCPIMGMVQDCGALGLTCVEPGACGQDTGTPTGDGLLCSDFDQCILDFCGPDLTAECMTQAFNNICLPQAATFAEASLYLTLNNCIGSFCQTSPSVEAQMSCITQSCLTDYAACFSGGLYGDGSCGDIDICVEASGCAAAGKVDFACARACYQDASQQANEDYWQFQLCVAGQCANDDDVPACAAAVGSGEICGPLLDVCLDVGPSTPPSQ